MGWIDRVDRAVGGTIAAGRWLVLPVALILFLQWPLRDFVRAHSREANDLGQWIFALYVSLAVTYATRERTHLAIDALAHDYPARVRGAIARWGGLLCVAPWAIFMLWTAWPTAQRSTLGLEKFPDTANFGYFLIKVAAVLLALLALVQALLDLRETRLMAAAGLWMLLAVAILLLATGLPAFAVLMGVSGTFAVLGVLTGSVEFGLLTALPTRIVGLLENDLLQALPLYVFMGALLNRLPLADRLFRCGVALGGRSGGAPALATLGLGALLAPMNGSVGASVAMLSRSVAPKLAARGVPPAESTALVCVASTLGVVIPPSLVLILLGDAMMRAHTEATNVTKAMGRIVNTQDIFRGALVPAALFLLLCLLVAWALGRRHPTRDAADRPAAMEWLTGLLAAAFVIDLLSGVAAGYFYAVEAAAMGGTALLLFGWASGGLRGGAFGAVLRDTMAVSGALFALFVAATTFTLLFRAFGTDHLLDAWVKLVPGGATGAAITVLVVFALSAFVLDAFEIVFVIVPIVMPPVLTRAPDAIWISVLALLALQASFLVPPTGYAVMMARSAVGQKVPIRPLAAALAPYLAAQLVVLTLVVLLPGLAHLAQPKGHDAPSTAPALDDDAARKRFNDMLKLPAQED